MIIDKVCGIDNGFSGFMVFLNCKTKEIVQMLSYPKQNPIELFKIFETYRPKHVVLEQPFITMGFKGVSSSNYEILGRYSQTLEYLNISYNTVRVQEWRKFLNIKAKGREANKQASIEKCKELFNEDNFRFFYSKKGSIVNHKRVEVKYIDDNKCESALIAYYAAQKYLEE